MPDFQRLTRLIVKHALVEKRFGLGYSLNFARPTAWIILLLVLMGPLIPIVAHLSRFLPKLGVK